MSVSARLRKRLTETFALDVDLALPGGITILFGASGSGKSTLLRCLAGLARPDSGRVAFGDRVVFDSRAAIDLPPQQRHVGVVFQQLALFPHLSVSANIGYGLTHLTPADRNARIAAIARDFRIDALLARKPSHISGGERQRVALARTLVTEPSVLLLDEPLTALDHDIQSRIIDDLRAWNDAHRVPVLYVTHSHREAYALGEQVIVLRDGAIVATGTPHAVLEHPVQGDIAQLAGFENLFEARVLAHDTDAGTMHVRLMPGDVELEVPLTGAAVGTTAVVAIRAGDIMVAREAPRGISARNIFQVTIDRLTRQGTTVVAEAYAGAGGSRFIIHLTPGGSASLSLESGSPVWLVIKTYSCRVGRGVTLPGNSSER